MKKLLNLALVLILACVTVFGVACDDGNKVFDTYWQVERSENSAGDTLLNYAIISLTRDSKPIKEVWINVSDTGAESVEIGIVFGHVATVTSTSYKNTDVPAKRSEIKKTDGWVKLLAEASYEYNYVRINVKDTVKINEVVCINTEDKIIPATLSCTGYKASASSSKEYSYDELTEMVENEEVKNTALNICDEQDKFDLTAVRDLYYSVFPKIV